MQTESIIVKNNKKMALVGRKFPNVTVDAISKSGENLRINVLEEAVKNQSKVLLFWYPTTLR